MRRVSFFLCISAFSAGAASAVAQEAPEEPKCELHVWSAEKFDDIPLIVGQLHFGRGRSDVPQDFESIATPELQISAVIEADPVTALGLPPDTKVIPHLTSEDLNTTNKRKGRREDSSNPCYFELHIRDHKLIQDIVWGDRFLTGFDFRYYTDNEKWTYRHKGKGGNKLKLFPIEEGTDFEDVEQKIATGIADNFLEYAKNAKPRIKRKIS
ncbi:hypothetical protein [Paraurantiacibacter namhicola]|uniref:hypothetical protein n=1 Tax=Paraurantiacibacter namhicola TaxID=645517 RepID=UPI0012EDA460|nr:hypothetical protein [Paraurantiacibacter namhicola]